MIELTEGAVLQAKNGKAAIKRAVVVRVSPLGVMLRQDGTQRGWWIDRGSVAKRWDVVPGDAKHPNAGPGG